MPISFGLTLTAREETRQRPLPMSPCSDLTIGTLTRRGRGQGWSVSSAATLAFATTLLCLPARANAHQNVPPNACIRPPADRYDPDVDFERASRSTTQPLGVVVARRAPPQPPGGANPEEIAEPPAPQLPGPEPRLELSFGSAEKFYNQELYDPGGFVTRKAIPVSTIRPVLDWLFQPRASVWLAFDLPLEPRSELNDEVTILTYVPPSLQSGVRFTFVNVNLLRDIWLDLQVDGGVGWVFSSREEVRLFPHIGWRLHLRDNSGFTAYAGVSYEFRLSVGALVYGVGHHF